MNIIQNRQSAKTATTRDEQSVKPIKNIARLPPNEAKCEILRIIQSKLRDILEEMPTGEVVDYSWCFMEVHHKKEW